MRYILILIFLVCSTFLGKAQHSKAKYYPQPELHKFEGDWKHEHNSIVFILRLKTEKIFFSGIYMDIIKGSYTYTKNGVVVSSSSASSKATAVTNGRLSNKDKSKFELTFTFDDPVNKKYGNALFKIDEANPEVALWVLKNSEGIHLKPFDTSFSVPVKMQFKKIN